MNYHIPTVFKVVFVASCYVPTSWNRSDPGVMENKTDSSIVILSMDILFHLLMLFVLNMIKSGESCYFIKANKDSVVNGLKHSLEVGLLINMLVMKQVILKARGDVKETYSKEYLIFSFYIFISTVSNPAIVENAKFHLKESNTFLDAQLETILSNCEIKPIESIRRFPFNHLIYGYYLWRVQKELDKTNDVFEDSVLCLSDENHYSDSSEIYNDYIITDGKFIIGFDFIYFLLGQYYRYVENMKYPNFEKVIKFHDKVLKVRHNNHVTSLYHTAVILYNLNKFDESIRLLDRVNKTNKSIFVVELNYKLLRAKNVFKLYGNYIGDHDDEQKHNINVQECKQADSVSVISTGISNTDRRELEEAVVFLQNFAEKASIKRKEYGVGNEIYQELLATKYIQQDKISKEKCLLKLVMNIKMYGNGFVEMKQYKQANIIYNTGIKLISSNSLDIVNVPSDGRQAYIHASIIKVNDNNSNNHDVGIRCDTYIDCQSVTGNSLFKFIGANHNFVQRVITVSDVASFDAEGNSQNVSVSSNIFSARNDLNLGIIGNLCEKYSNMVINDPGKLALIKYKSTGTNKTQFDITSIYFKESTSHIILNNCRYDTSPSKIDYIITICKLERCNYLLHNREMIISRNG